MGIKSSINYQDNNHNYNNMKVFIAIISALLAVAAAAPSEEASGPQADAGVQSKHFGGYGYNGYPLLGAGYHYPSYSGYHYGHYPAYTYPSYGHYQGYNGYRPCYGYACILRNK